ncbi:MAG: wax ester/triacylglycerol synthase family O-acyltransferase [Candidatus Binatia bacterium]
MESAFANRMNPTDALFWLLDKVPDLRSTIAALVILERPPTRQRIHEEFERLSCRLVRLRQRVREVPFGLAPPEWVEDPQFDCNYHLRCLAVPAPGGMDELLEEISPFYATAFDPERPLWEAYVVEGLAGGRGALFIKMHHCLTDGVGGVQLSEMLLSHQAGSSPTMIKAVADRRSITPIALLWRATFHNVNDAVQVCRSALGWAATAALAPTTTWRAVPRVVRAVAGFAQELAVPRAESPLHHRRSLSRRLSTFEMSLHEIDAVRGKLSATNNDIVLTIVSGAMHRWHTSRGADTRELRTLVPVSLRRPDDVSAGNRLALLAVPLPVGELNPLRRLRIIQDRMGQVKGDRRAALYPLLARLMIALPLALAKRIGRQQTTRTNFVCTNVPGPRRPRYLAGELVEKIYPYAPLVGDHPVAIALYSYRDTMCVGLDVDPLAMDDLPRFRDMLQESYDEILNVGRQIPHSAARPGRRRGPRKQLRISQ